MADTEKQTPISRTVCGTLRRDGHWKCLGLTLMITGCLATIFWCHFDTTEKAVLTYSEMSFSNSERTGPCRKGYIYIPVACVVMLYLVYLVECWHSHAWLELKYKCDIATVYSTIKKMQEALPVIWWKATCYHYVRRTRQVMRYRNGDAFTTTQVYYERVDSNTAGAAFNFTRCGVKDISRPLSDLEKYPAIKIKISKGFSFVNLDTEFEFEEQRSQFFQEYETKDDYMEGREGMDLINVDFKEYIIAFRDPNNLPWYVSHVVFWIASLILLSWPLRTIIEFKTAHMHYHIHKLFGSNCVDSTNYPGLISRMSTMNSSEFELSIRNNNVIVPSYSEVMLADTREQLQRRDYGTIKTHPSKFPRSLTNVTLAGRTSRRSFTPTVMMNQVKKFKSCNVFGKSQSTESSLDDGTIRYQLQRLVRERGRIQRKETGISQWSVPSMSTEQLTDRFNSTSEISANNLARKSNILYHSIVPTKINETLSVITGTCNEVISGSHETQSKYQGLQIMRCMRHKRLDKPLNILTRSKSVPASSMCAQDSLSQYIHSDGSPTDSLTNVLDLNLEQTTNSSSLLSANNDAASTIIIPSIPSSPPGYEEAIKMRQITSSFNPRTALESVKHSSQSGLLRSSSVIQTRSKMSVLGARTPLKGKCTTKIAVDTLPIDPEINKRQVTDSNHDVSNLDNFRLHSLTGSEEGQYYSSQHQHKPSQKQQRLATTMFKALPKISKVSHDESKESDEECLHNTNSVLETLDNTPSRDDCLSNRTSQLRSSEFRSISHFAATLIAEDGTGDPSTSPNQRPKRSTPSTMVSTGSAAVRAERCRLQAHSRLRMETSV